MTIRVRADPTNPGQFFACCGILEIADRLGSGAEGWFEIDHFVVGKDTMPLSDLLSTFKRCALASLPDDSDASDEDDDEGDDSDSDSIEISLPIPLRLDWWNEKSLKTWAGSMKVRVIFRSMTQAIDVSCSDPLNDGRVVYDPVVQKHTSRKPKKGKKREPFYFDARRGANAHPLDVGFAPDPLNMTTRAFAAVESLCLVGLQRFRPMPTGTPRLFHYFTWTEPLPPQVAASAACGLLPCAGGAAFEFENAFRTDQRKHKAFMPATLIQGAR